MTTTPTPSGREGHDIVERLRDAFYEVAVCHCGNGLHSGGCDNHDASWNPCHESQLLSDARHEIERLRSPSAALAALRAEVRAWRAHDKTQWDFHNGVHGASVRVAATQRHLTECTAATDACNALGGEGGKQ